MDRITARTEVRDIIGEDDPGDFWTNTELNRHLNEAQRHFNGEAIWPWLITEATGSLADGVSDFDLPTGVDTGRAINVSLNIEGQVWGMYQPKRVTSTKGFQLRRMYSSTTTAARPNWYYVTSVADGSGESLYTVTIRFIPAPTSVMEMEYQYFRVVSDMTSDSDLPDVPVEYHKAVVHYAAGTAWLKELNGGGKAKEQFELYNAVTESAKRRFFADAPDQPLVMGKDEPQYGRFEFPGDEWQLRVAQTLGP